MPKKQRRHEASDKKAIIAFIRNFHALDKKVGIKRIEAKLQELYASEVKNRPTLIRNRIFEEISRLYGAPIRSLLKSSTRGKIKEAQIMAMLLLYAYAGLAKTELARIFGHVQSNVISVRIRTFKHIYNGEPTKPGDHLYAKIYSNDFMEKLITASDKIDAFVKSEITPLSDWKKW